MNALKKFALMFSASSCILVASCLGIGRLLVTTDIKPTPFAFSNETVNYSAALNCASCCIVFLFPEEFDVDELASIGEVSSLQWIVDLCAKHRIESHPVRTNMRWIKNHGYDNSFRCVVHLRVGHFVVVQGSSDGGIVIDPASLKCFSLHAFSKE
jgi:hypothetical protein